MKFVAAPATRQDGSYWKPSIGRKPERRCPISSSASGASLENSPYHFSISHTDRHAFCALSRRPVGIDAEELDRAVRFSLVSRILSPQEQQRFHRAEDPQRAFLALWVLKEAAAKCTGAGLTGFPNRTDFSPDDSRVFTWRGCLVAVIGQENETERRILHDF